MKLLPIATALSAALLPAGASANDASGETGRVIATIEAMTSAFAAGDIDAILETYEAGAVVVGEPGKPSAGKAALRTMFEGFVAADPTFTYLGHDVIVAGDIALHLMPWTMTATMPDGVAIEDGGLSVAVLRRQVDGTWLMVIDEPHGDATTRK